MENMHTRYRILRALTLNGALTAKGIASVCNITSSAALSGARRLCKLGLAEEQTVLNPSRKNQPRFAAVKGARNKTATLGVHLTDGIIELRLVYPDGKEISQATLILGDEYTEDTAVTAVTEHIDRLINSAKCKTLCIGVTAQGPVLLQNGLLRQVTSVGGVDITLLCKELTEAFCIPVYTLFDAESAGMYRLMRDKTAAEGVFVSLCSGETVAAAIFCDGKCIHANGLTGLIGHTSLNIRDERCYCGNRGCLEHYVSTDLLVDRVQTNTLFGVNMRSFDDTVELYAEGDPAVRKEVDELVAHLAEGIVGIVWTLNPSQVYVNGETTRFAGALNTPIHSVIKQRVLPEAFSRLTVSVSDNAAEEYAVGAALYAMQEALK